MALSGFWFLPFVICQILFGAKNPYTIYIYTNIFIFIKLNMAIWHEKIETPWENFSTLARLWFSGFRYKWGSLFFHARLPDLVFNLARTRVVAGFFDMANYKPEKPAARCCQIAILPVQSWTLLNSRNQIFEQILLSAWFARVLAN